MGYSDRAHIQCSIARLLFYKHGSIIVTASHETRKVSPVVQTSATE